MITAEGHSEVSLAEKQEALAALLDSAALGRSEQLRHLFRYICTEEIEGRGAALSEYAIGVNALGRPAVYSPETDSTVRSRAHELRKRLDEFYRGEGKYTAVRVDLPRGSYRPRFTRTAGAANPVPETVASRDVLPVRTGRKAMVVVGLAIVLIALALVWVAGQSMSPAEAALRAVWGPILDTRETVTIAVATTTQLWVRNLDGHPPPLQDPPFTLPTPEDELFREWYARMNQTEPQGLFLHPNGNSPLWGDAAAAVTATRFLTSRGIRTEVLPERAVRPAALKSRNTIVLGRPEYSLAARTLQPQGGFVLRYLPERRQMGIVDDSTGESYFREDGGRTNYGLITISGASGSAGEPHRIIVCSGINSDGSQAGMDFLASPERLSALAEAMGFGPRGRWPEAFQVVVRTRSSDTFVIRAEYAAHRVLQPAR